MDIELSKLVTILIDSVPVLQASVLVDKCHDLGMTPQPYQPTSSDNDLPHFDKGYQFVFETQDSIGAGLDILEKQGDILQAGFQIFYPSFLFFSNSKKHYRNMVAQLEDHYGKSSPLRTGGRNTLNYEDFNTVSYISKMRIYGNDMLTLRVGNRELLY